MAGNGYKDPTRETLESGRSVADVLPSRGMSRGLKGVIVSKAGVNGCPTGFDPHDRRGITIHIEPDSDNSQSFQLADFTKEAVREAVDRAKAQVPGNDIEAIRERAAMAFEELATITNAGVVKKVDAEARPPVPAAFADDLRRMQRVTQPGPAAPQPVLAPQPEADRNYSPMAAFGLKRASTPPSRAATQVKPANSGPPSKLIYFEKEGIGTVPAFFHDAYVELNDDADKSGFIVLVYDLRYEQAAARWFPPSDDPYKRPWAVKLQNDERLYLVHTTGFQFTYDSREFCALLVERSLIAED